MWAFGETRPYSRLENGARSQQTFAISQRIDSLVGLVGKTENL
jgi:hypothetical protein